MHALLAPEHLHEMPLAGAAFIPAAVASIALAIALVLRPDNRALPALAVALLAAEILVYLAVVAAGAEPVENVALVCKVAEAVGIAAAFRRPQRLNRGMAAVAGLAGAGAGIFATAALAAPASMSMLLLPPQVVTMPGRSFDPTLVIAVTGQTIDWSNADTNSHTVTADGEGFDSGTIPPGGGFTWTPTRPGVYTYHCTIHRFMHGEVDVYDVALLGPQHPVGAGAAFALRGVAPSPRSPITLEDDRSGMIVSTATSADDGTFVFTLTADARATFRAHADAATSPPYTLIVAARPALTVLRRDGSRYTLSVSTAPPQPGARIDLQQYVPERFGWRSMERGRLDGQSHAVLDVRARAGRRLRIAMIGGVDGYSGGVSRSVRLP